ncbi:MAG TPA: hybrid sensor histidine kinase/response regulator [Steroidobacteraceae bacterium]|nr:hybrid sensor histidine kinase/response regulator [Steroidobacteraceae bacterium]
MPQRIKCLLVDDLEEDLLGLAALLQRDDVELLTARSGEEALRQLQGHDVALAFLDVQMPDMDGFELAERIRGNERTRHVPLILMTAGPRERQRIFKGYESGAVDFLHKPIEAPILRNKADVFFELYRQRQQLAEELRNRADTLRSNEMFTALLAHDLRNPLSAILASARLLQRRSSDPHAQEAATRILSSGKRMGRLIEDMLDLARVRLAGGLTLKREPGDFRALVERVIREHQSAAPERLIESTYAGEFSGFWDAERIAQVASNLVGNALKHGNPHTAVVVRLDGTEVDSVSLSVVNSGTIPEELKDHLFDPFHGGRRPAGRGEGLGLGLYIVFQIVKGHRGTIEVESGRNDQTTFRIVLPRSAG